MAHLSGFSQAAQVLKNCAPQAFQDFLNEFNTYTHEVTVAVMDAPSEDVLQMQGRAKQCRALLKELASLK